MHLDVIDICLLVSKHSFYKGVHAIIPVSKMANMKGNRVCNPLILLIDILGTLLVPLC